MHLGFRSIFRSKYSDKSSTLVSTTLLPCMIVFHILIFRDVYCTCRQVYISLPPTHLIGGVRGESHINSVFIQCFIYQFFSLQHSGEIPNECVASFCLCATVFQHLTWAISYWIRFWCVFLVFFFPHLSYPVVLLIWNVSLKMCFQSLEGVFAFDWLIFFPLLWTLRINPGARSTLGKWHLPRPQNCSELVLITY